MKEVVVLKKMFIINNPQAEKNIAFYTGVGRAYNGHQ